MHKMFSSQTLAQPEVYETLNRLLSEFEGEFTVTPYKKGVAFPLDDARANERFNFIGGALLEIQWVSSLDDVMLTIRSPKKEGSFLTITLKKLDAVEIDGPMIDTIG